MSRSGAGSATLRWILLGPLVAVVVVVSYIAIEASDLALGTVSSSVIAAVGLGCLVLVIALYVLSLRSRSTEGIRLRLDRIAAPTTPPNSGGSPRDTEPGAAQDELEQTDETDIHEPPMATGKSGDSEASLGDSESTVDAAAIDGQSTQSAPPRKLPAGMPPSSPRSSTPSRGRTDTGEFLEAPGFDAMRLAAVLNRYEETGFPTDSHATSSDSGSQSDEQDLGKRGLWSDLVETYGAESIDLSGIRAGRCRITLSSGNMVLYVPEFHQWVWLVLSRGGSGISAVDDRDTAKLTAAQSAEEDGSAADGTVVDLTDTGIQSHHQDAVGQPS